MTDTITLFYCPSCDLHFRSVYARHSIRVSGSVFVRRDGKGFALDGEIDDPYERPVLLVQEPDWGCHMCGHTAKIVQIPRDECPHDWETFNASDGQPARRCRFCNEVQSGRIVYIVYERNDDD